MSLLRLEGIEKRFGGVVALNRLSFTVEAGEILGIMGANGAGTGRPSGFLNSLCHEH